MSGTIITLGVKGIGVVANKIVGYALAWSTGLRYTAIVAVVGALVITVLWSVFGRNKFFPKDKSYVDLQSKEIVKSLHADPVHITHLPSFDARKLQYLQRPKYSPSALT